MGVAYGSSTIYQATKGIVQDGLVLSVDAGVKESYDGAGKLKDLTGNPLNDATRYNGIIFNKDSGGSFVSDGVDDYLLTGVNTALNIIDFSASVSCRIINNNSSQYIFSRYVSPSGWLISANYDATEDAYQISFHGRESGAVYLRCDTSHDYSPGNYIITVTKSADQWKIYVNGIEAVSNTLGNGTTAFASNSVYICGKAHYSSTISNTQVYNCQVYNRALTAIEVAQNFNVTRHRFGI